MVLLGCTNDGHLVTGDFVATDEVSANVKVAADECATTRIDTQISLALKVNLHLLLAHEFRFAVQAMDLFAGRTTHVDECLSTANKVFRKDGLFNLDLAAAIGAFNSTKSLILFFSRCHLEQLLEVKGDTGLCH